MNYISMYIEEVYKPHKWFDIHGLTPLATLITLTTYLREFKNLLKTRHINFNWFEVGENLNLALHYYYQGLRLPVLSSDIKTYFYFWLIVACTLSLEEKIDGTVLMENCPIHEISNVQVQFKIHILFRFSTPWNLNFVRCTYVWVQEKSLKWKIHTVRVMTSKFCRIELRSFRSSVASGRRNVIVELICFNKT